MSRSSWRHLFVRQVVRAAAFTAFTFAALTVFLWFIGCPVSVHLVPYLLAVIRCWLIGALFLSFVNAARVIDEARNE